MAGNIEKDFLLQIQDRIKKLETEVQDLRDRLSVYVLKYKLTTNEFSNGASLCWNVCEPIEKAKIIFHDSGRETEAHKEYWQAMIIDDISLYDPDDTLTLLLPIETNSIGIFPITFTISQLTVHKLLTSIYDFYQKNITMENIQLLKRYDEFLHDISAKDIIVGTKWSDLEMVKYLMLTQFNVIPCNENVFELYCI